MGCVFPFLYSIFHIFFTKYIFLHGAVKSEIISYQWTRTKVSSSPAPPHPKNSQPTLESSSIQTAEPIVKCHCTVLYCTKMFFFFNSVQEVGGAVAGGV